MSLLVRFTPHLIGIVIFVSWYAAGSYGALRAIAGIFGILSVAALIESRIRAENAPLNSWDERLPRNWGFLTLGLSILSYALASVSGVEGPVSGVQWCSAETVVLDSATTPSALVDRITFPSVSVSGTATIDLEIGNAPGRDSVLVHWRYETPTMAMLCNPNTAIFTDSAGEELLEFFRPWIQAIVNESGSGLQSEAKILKLVSRVFEEHGVTVDWVQIKLYGS